MEKIVGVDTRLLMVAAQVARDWHGENKEWIRNDFARFAKPFWRKWGGEELVNYMMGKYVNNDNKSIVEYMCNLDQRNLRLIVAYLQERSSYLPDYMVISLTQERV